MYGIDGRRNLTGRRIAPSGWPPPFPLVRIGNGAASQLQMDMYGALMDAVYLYNKHVAHPFPMISGSTFAAFLDFVLR